MAEAPQRKTWGFAHVPALDGLRGAAVAAVLLFHAGHLTGGYLGVDLFFVLSGFLITSLLLSERTTTGRIDLRAFWGRRVRRLLPGLLLLLLGVAAFAALIARPIDLDSIRADGFAALFYVANWHTIYQGTSYWTQSVAPSPLQHVWSLAIEEQFYLLWPLLVVAVTRRRREPAQMVWWVSIGLAVTSMLAFIVLYRTGASDTRIYEGTDTRAAALLMGAALAAWRSWQRPMGQQVRADEATATPVWITELSGLAAATGLGVLWVTLDGTSPQFYRGGLFSASLLGLWLIAVVSQPGVTVVGRVFSLSSLRFLGRISYGLYLWHWPIFLAIDRRNGQLPFMGDRYLHDPWLLLVKLLLSVGMATLSYHLVEMPIRRGAISRRLVPSISFGAIAGAAVLIFVSTIGGVPILDPSAADQQARVIVDGAPRMVFAGDSVALSVSAKATADPAAFGVNPVDRTLVSCSIAFGGRRSRMNNGSESGTPVSCADPVLADLDAVAPNIVFFMTGSRPNGSSEIDGEFVQACDPPFDQQYARDLTSLVKRFRQTGALVVLGTTPYSSINAFGVEGSEERIACVNRVIEQVAGAVPGTFVIDVNEYLCPDGTCFESIDGGPVRSDGLHFDDGPGGLAVSRWIVDQALDLTGYQVPGGG